MTSIYNTGTVTVTNGSAAVVGTGTGWAVSLVTGGTLNIEAPGNPMPIATVADDTHLTGVVKWTGASGTYSYAIVREDSDAANVVDLYDKLTRVLITLSLAGIHPNNSGSLAKRDALSLTADDDNYLFLRAELGVAFAFYRWDGPTLAWIGPFPVADAAAGGPVSSLVGGNGITVDSTNPAVPAVSATRPGTAKTTPVDADELSLFDSVASFVLKRLTWANLKATLLTTATFITSLTGPKVVGGTGAGSSLTLQSTSGVGTADFIDFLVGNNGATRAARFDTSGNFLQGITTAASFAQEAGVGGTVATMQLHSGGTVGLAMARWAANAVGGRAIFAKSRGGGPGTRGVVSNADSLGAFIFNGDDGTNFQAAAFFGGYVDGTPGAGVMPGRIVFGTTPTGSSVPVERFRIDSAGALSHRNNGQVIVDANSSFGLRQYAAGSLPSQAAGFFIQSSDIVGADLSSDGTQWTSPGVKVLNAVTANTTISIPPGWAVEEILFANTTANAVTGGVKIGTTSGATDVVAAQAIGASAIGHVTDANILKRLFSRTVAQTLFVQAVTSWNSASVELSFVLRKVL